jgi:luciferase family oxidoreductase group 1
MDTSTNLNIPFSVLDLANVAQGNSHADTFANSVSLAQHTENLDYNRYWFAEHHNMISVASSATSILIGHIAGHTKKIRVGSGGIMLPNHSPLIIAEQFGTLASIYPNRIDLGLGRAPGTDQPTAMEIRGERFSSSHNFPQDVLKVQRFLSNSNSGARVRAIPGEGTNVPVWILGSSTESAHLAASYGLPYAFASHFAPTYFFEAIEIYRKNFRPSAVLDKPYVMACVNAIIADTDAEADRLASSMYQMFMGIITGERNLLQAPVDNMDEIWNEMEEHAVKQMLAFSFIAGKENLKSILKKFIEQTEINEIMISAPIYDHNAKLYSFKLFSEVLKSL